ncbi:MAG TPA: glycosyltransferase family protein [Candidatus Acidoferrales bacterium]|nr:glycosyltransferase family protein [Candidatus Acidoferrales bacterium]
MKLMFCVLGEGRGHMTQAMAVKEMTGAAGHELVAVTLGVSAHRQVPAYFESAMKTTVRQLPTLEFKYKDSRAVSNTATLLGVLGNLPKYRRIVRQLDDIVRETKPDVILNFFEPIAAFYALTRKHRPPVVAIGHQFMFQHPGYVRTPDLWKQLLSMKLYTQLLGARATKLALSLYEAPDLPAKRIIVGPPILRKQLFGLTPNPNGEFTLVYLLNHGYAEQIIQWSDANPKTRLHCFYDKPGAPAEFQHSAALTFHKLDGEKFLKMMAECRNVVCTAGFESVSEAAWLGKPLFLVPVENHVEQQVNAIDAQQFGIGLAEKSFNLDRLAELPDRLPTDKFRAWMDCAPQKLFQAIEQAVKSSR